MTSEEIVRKKKQLESEIEELDKEYYKTKAEELLKEAEFKPNHYYKILGKHLIYFKYTSDCYMDKYGLHIPIAIEESFGLAFFAYTIRSNVVIPTDDFMVNILEEDRVDEISKKDMDEIVEQINEYIGRII